VTTLDPVLDKIELETPQPLFWARGRAGGEGAPDLVAATEAALSERLSVALFDQPYRVAGRRSLPRAPSLDEAWTAVVEQLGARELAGLPPVVGGRSLGGRVACRTAAQTGAVAVLRLAFPLQPPRRRQTPAEPGAGARCRNGADVGRPGRARFLRDPTRGRSSRSRPGRR
jgi:predicted alpha/beta-hydrolase family hydrolase